MKSILTPRQFAEAIGVSESSVKRWVDDGHIAATRTAGGHRRISIQEAARYIRETSTVVVRPDLLGMTDVTAFGTPQAAIDDAGEQLFDFLKSGAAAEARGLVLSLFLEGRTVAEIVDGPLEHAMGEVGKAWVANASGIYWEHRATQIAISAIARLRMLLAPRPNAAFAVGGAPSDDPYILPSMAVAAVLESEGINATNLGPDTPIDSLALAIEDLDAKLAWLSVSVVADAERLRRQILGLADRLAERGSILVVGGARAPKLSLPRSQAIYTGRSMAELEALVKGMRIAPGVSSSGGAAAGGTTAESA
jgi:excisionase family DNA binding protein